MFFFGMTTTLFKHHVTCQTRPKHFSSYGWNCAMRWKLQNRAKNPQEMTFEPPPKPQNIHQNQQIQSLSLPESLDQKSELCCSAKSDQILSNWSYLIRQYLSKKAPREALLVYTRIRRNGIYSLGLVPLLFKACAMRSMIHSGRALHAESIKAGIVIDVIVGTSLVDMYGKCGEIVDSRKVFDYMPERNVLTWNAVIGGYMRNGDVNSASVLFEKMLMRTEVTWIEMIDGFARNGDTASAMNLFDQVPHDLKNVVTWTVMVDGYTSKGEMEAAREVFEGMPQRNFFVWSSMIAGYCKKGDVHEARVIFDQIPERNLVNWNALISGYAQNGFCEEALEAFEKMQDEGFEPDEVTVVSALSACAQLGLLDAGKEIHSEINRKAIKLNQFVLNALVDMYAKCGDLANAILIFDRMTQRNTACWNSMISGFATHGHCEEALKLFAMMEESNVQPDEITVLSVLSACAHGGFVNEGLQIFSKMQKYSVLPSIKHYGCLVDLLGRAGRLKEAYDLIKRMPMKPNDAVWGALLGACRIHMDTETAERVMDEVGKPESGMQSGDDTHYVLLSNIYAASSKWEKAEGTRMFMVNKGLQKTPGCSSIMLSSSTVHQFHSRRW